MDKGKFRESVPWLLGGGGVAALFAAVAAMSPMMGLAMVGGVVLLTGVAVLVNSPQVITPVAYATVGLLFVDISPVAIGGSAVRLYQPLSVMILAGALVAPKAKMGAGVGPAFKWLFVFTAMVAASYAWTISPQDTIVVAAGQAYLLFLFCVVCMLLNRGHVTLAGLQTALWAGALVTSVFAVGQFFGGFAGLTWQLQRVTGIPWARPAGLMLEPDWAAVAAGIGFMLALYRPMGSKYRALSLCVFALVLIVTGVRAVWLAAAVVCVLLLFAPKYRGKVFKAGLVALSVVGLVAFFVNGYYPNMLSDAFGRLDPANLFDSKADGGALDSRLGVLELISDQGGINALLGHGAGSLAHATSLNINAVRYVGGGELNAGRGSANLLATSYWDIGQVGVVVVAMLILSWFFSAWKIRRSVPVMLPLAIFLIVDFQANNGIRFGFVWVLLAIASWAVRNKEAPSSPPVEVQQAGKVSGLEVVGHVVR